MVGLFALVLDLTSLLMALAYVLLGLASVVVFLLPFFQSLGSFLEAIDSSVLVLSGPAGIWAIMAWRAMRSWILLLSSAFILACSMGPKAWASMAGGQDLALGGGDLITLEMVSISVAAGECLTCMVAPSSYSILVAPSAMAMAGWLD